MLTDQAGLNILILHVDELLWEVDIKLEGGKKAMTVMISNAGDCFGLYFWLLQ